MLDLLHSLLIFNNLQNQYLDLSQNCENHNPDSTTYRQLKIGTTQNSENI